MPESETHLALVRSMVAWIAAEYFDGEVGPILVDSAGSSALSRPRSVGGYVPDVFAVKVGFAIVGEAKTDRDLENPHAVNQIRAFLRHCYTLSAGILVLAVPWYRVNYVRNLLKELCEELGYTQDRWKVLELLPG